MSLVGIFGGTFDPVHLGHVKMAQQAQSLLALQQVMLVPCHQPPHRGAPQLTSSQRLHLLSLATNQLDGLIVDCRELERDGPSYTVDTLVSFRKELSPSTHLVLLMGADAYSQLTTWYQWQDILSLSHIAVFARPGYDVPRSGVLAELIADSFLAQLHQQPAGAVVTLQQLQMDISATAIRQSLIRGEIPDTLHPAVSQYIAKHELYGYQASSASDKRINNGR